MRKVIRIDEPKEESKKPIELTSYFNAHEWVDEKFSAERYEKVVYLGEDRLQGSLFACYIDDCIIMCTGNLNDGVY